MVYTLPLSAGTWSTMKTVGKNIARVEGRDKVTGAAKYVDDYRFPDMWFGKTVRSAIPRGRIVSMNFSDRFDWSKVVIADSRDIPHRNVVALIVDDQPLLAESVVNHIGEPILLIAAPSKELAQEAAAHVEVKYEEMTPVLTIEDSLAGVEKLCGGNNLFKEYTISRGDVAEAWKDAEVIVEETYRVGHQEQLYIEPNGMIATPGEDGSVTVIGSLQCPYYVHRALKEIFGLADEHVTVIQAVTGGGFGGKEDFPSMLAGHAALLARKCGRPVKMVYDRAEDFAFTTKRHPAIVHHRTGVTRDGRLVAAEIDLILDGGAYCTLSPVVLSRGIIHALGPYNCPHVHIRGRAVATNTPPNGAFRGFGVPQACFAGEMQMEKIARTLSISPAELRRKNLLRLGDITPTGQKLEYSVGTELVLDDVLERSNYLARAGQQAPAGNKRRGFGLSLYYHGGGFTGGGEDKIKGKASLVLKHDGRVRILTASTEIGQGTRTIFPQIVADELGIPIDEVEFEDSDTSKVPDSGPTVASRTCMVVGKVVQMAAAQLKHEMAARVAKAKGCDPSSVSFEGGSIFVRGEESSMVRVGFAEAARLCLGDSHGIKTTAQYASPPSIHWDDENYSGDAYPVYSYAADVVEVEVDMDTYEVKVLSVVTATDVGRAINPVTAEGQIEGGTAQALGYGLCEEVVWKDGRMLNGRLTNYIIPTALDVPEMETSLVENPYPYGPFGAKGIGELPMDGGAPALAAAISDAIGALITELPATPERIMDAMGDTLQAC